MALFRTLNALRRDVVSLALQAAGLKKTKAKGGGGKPVLYRTSLHPAPHRRPASPQQSVLSPSTLNVLGVVRETADAVSIVLARADGGAIEFKAGMFYTVIVTIDGQEYRRAYSVSSAAQDNTTVTITVKRVANGKVSNWLNDQLTAGSTLRVLGPSGSFVLEPSTAQARKLLLVGGGSGITPLMSMVRTVLSQEPLSHIELLYGNRSKKDTIFYAALNALVKQHPDRFAITHVLEKPPKAWQGETGRLDRAMFAGLLDGILATSALGDLEVYTCGPSPVMQGVLDELVARGFPAERFHQEKFTPAAGAPDSARFERQTVSVHAQGQTWTETAQPGQTLLEAGLASGAPMLFSCTLGGCGRCRVKILEGEVDMPEPNCLLPEEKAQGYALSCIARPCCAVSFEIDPPQSH